MSSRTSSRNSGVVVNGTRGGGAGDMPSTRKSSARAARAEFAQGASSSISSSLEVLEHGDTDEASTRSSSRLSLGSRSRSNLGQVPPRSDSSLSQRVTTPTKHVSLTAVRRKQEVDAPIEPELDWREFSRSNSRLGLGGRTYSNTFRLTETVEDETPADCEQTQGSEEQACAMPSDSASGMTTQMEAMALENTGQLQVKESKESSDDDDDDDDDDSDSEEEPRKAPNELLMEFLDCVMKKDFKNAEKLCRMILIYEPTNQEALTFHPVIMEKLQLEQEAAEEGSGEDDDDDDGDDNDDDDDDDEDDDSEEDSSLENDSSDDDDDDEDNDENNLPEEAAPARPDSGIGM